MKISKFYEEDYSSYAFYDAYRSLCSIVDGLKPSARKVIHTIRKNNITSPQKVSILAGKVSFENEYLHSQVSLEGVISGLAQDFCGSNNLNLLLPEGSFGNRNIPEPAASRYIFTCKNSIIDDIFKKDDDKLLSQQEFEGTIIEPKFFVPVLPLVLVNGSEGVGTGFAQKILPRKPSDLIKCIIKYLKHKKIDTSLLDVYYNGFTGEYRNLGNGKWEIRGCIDRLNTSSFNITELPIGISLQQYIKVLDKLENDKVIKSYIDKSEDNKFLFEVKCEREFLKQDDEVILDTLKLIKRVTENYTCISENNSVIEFQSIEQLLLKYIDVRYEYYSKRRIFLLEKYKNEIEFLENKIKFISDVMDKRLVIFNKSKNDICERMEKLKYKKVDDSYEYLLTMRIDSFILEKVEVLKKEKQKVQELMTDVIDTSCSDMWIRELKQLERIIK